MRGWENEDLRFVRRKVERIWMATVDIPTSTFMILLIVIISHTTTKITILYKETVTIEILIRQDPKPNAPKILPLRAHKRRHLLLARNLLRFNPNETS